MIVRQLFVVLVILNLGVAAWWLFHRETPHTAPLPQDGVPVLQLADAAHPASTPPAGRPVTTPVPAPQPTPVEAPLPVDAVCAGFGPFADATAAQAARVVLEPRVLQLRARQVQQRGRGFNVVIPPLGSSEAAAAMAERLRAAGVNDLFVIRDGADATGIALGRFGSAESANRRAEELKAKGFDARAQAAGRPVFWLDVGAAAGFDMNAARAASGASEVNRMACTAPSG